MRFLLFIIFNITIIMFFNFIWNCSKSFCWLSFLRILIGDFHDSIIISNKHTVIRIDWYFLQIFEGLSIKNRESILKRENNYSGTNHNVEHFLFKPDSELWLPFFDVPNQHIKLFRPVDHRSWPKSLRLLESLPLVLVLEYSLQR